MIYIIHIAYHDFKGQELGFSVLGFHVQALENYKGLFNSNCAIMEPSM